MRIALIADIHANLHALEAVLEHCASQNVDTIWNLGDFVGYGAHPEEVVQRISNEFILSILGNYDRKVLTIERQPQKWKQKKVPLKLFAFQWAYQQLSAGSICYLQSLPEKINLKIMDWRVMLVHGSPESREEHLGLFTMETRLQQLTQVANADIILCGHSHQPFYRQASSTWFINPGSVGRPDDGDYRSSYAVIELKKQSIKIEHLRLDYDLDRTIFEMRQKGIPEEFISMIKEGRNLDAIVT